MSQHRLILSHIRAATYLPYSYFQRAAGNIRCCGEIMASDYLDALRPLFDCLSDGICVADATGRLLYANAAAGELLGPKSEDASSVAICDLLCAGFEGCCVKDGNSCPLRIPRGKQNSMTFKGRYAPTNRELRLRCLRVRLPSLERHFLIIEDVTAQAEAGKQREAWRQMLAHDFRSPQLP
ncbi:MAG: PAS domain-containing protein [Chloroflexota bacterium]